MIQMMKQMTGKIGSNIYASVQDQNNPHHLSFLRRLQKEMREKDSLHTPLKQLKAVVLDFETTGFYPEKGDQILSIGAVKVHGESIVADETYYSLVQSTDTIPDQITELTGIKLEDLHDAPSLATALTQFFEFSKDYLFVAHHSMHEQSFLKQATKALTRSAFQQRIVDTSLIVRIIEPTLHLKSLEACCTHFGIEVNGRHHALHDAYMTAQLWSRYIQFFQDQGYQNLREIYETLAK